MEDSGVDRRNAHPAAALDRDGALAVFQKNCGKGEAPAIRADGFHADDNPQSIEQSIETFPRPFMTVSNITGYCGTPISQAGPMLGSDSV